MNKKERLRVFNKYKGRCAYCGCILPLKGWHLDHVEPVIRKWKYKLLPSGIRSGDKVPDGFQHPDRDCYDNAVASCASCNINKHGDSVEQFRANIKHYLVSLNLRMVQYKMARKYGLVTETGNDVIFYFEKHDPNDID